MEKDERHDGVSGTAGPEQAGAPDGQETCCGPACGCEPGGAGEGPPSRLQTRVRALLFSLVVLAAVIVAANSIWKARAKGSSSPKAAQACCEKPCENGEKTCGGAEDSDAKPE